MRHVTYGVCDCRKTALHLAAGKGLVPVVDMLLAAGAKLDVTDQEGWTPLHDAIAYRGCDVGATSTIVRKFCSAMSHDRSFIDRQNMDGETALHMAARFGHKHAVDTLLEFKPHLEITDNDGWIPLHSAVKVDPQIVRTIINAIKNSKQVVLSFYLPPPQLGTVDVLICVGLSPARS